jgi:hypothetical protein
MIKTSVNYTFDLGTMISKGQLNGLSNSFSLNPAISP